MKTPGAASRVRKPRESSVTPSGSTLMQCLQTSILMTDIQRITVRDERDGIQAVADFTSSAREQMIMAAIAQPQKPEKFGNWFR
jgi:ethanolamine utilization cobalamin adenosyltransferase